MPARPTSLSECPICRCPLAAEAVECPRCGESFVEVIPEGAEGAGSPNPAKGTREKFLFYAGIALILVGGPGIGLGSWLHDVLRISYLNYNSFDVFGPANRLVLGLGLIVMIVGVVFLILSLRLTRSADLESAA
jgi:hypothetical protein